MKIRLYGTVPDSIVDGPGLRYAVFTQGCNHACPGCHNPESQPFDGGTETTVQAVFDDITANPLVHDVTLTGGDPFCQAEPCAQLASMLRDAGYGVWAYTGSLYEDLLANGTPAQLRLLDNIDVLVDGPFVEAKKSYELDWRGSANQRLIDMNATRAAGNVVLWTHSEYVPPKPTNW